ncbi:hypothetical protein LXA43DRAFT_684875 [Ganoderma leucocontextum]|nr:hypothetical protein LXA43DRAFT_684875 [Ganoderma leucocontextum]
MSPPGPDYSKGVPTALRRCDHCGSPDRTLRKCARCSLVSYCSKECQKAAWPGHKSQCQTVIDWQNGDGIYAEKPTGGRFSGFATMHAFMRAIDDFLKAHAWAFHNDARALVASKGGIEWLQSTPPKIITIRLRPSFANTSTQWDRNPATPFKFVSSSYMTSAEYDDLIANTAHGWSSEAMTTARINSFRKMQARFGAEFAGLIPVNITVDGMVFTRFEFFPLRRTRALPPDLEGKEHEILGDARVLFKQSVNFGFPLRVSGMDPRYAYPGKFVRAHDHRKWEWTALFEDWAAYDGGNEDLDATLGKLTSGLSVADVISNVQRL